ncbi:hypothetical protein Afil01_21220 [Actinorhabdospora filicis]|uniref:Uncharacterized protein n=1 Tax=Actinorhabdospora filicis TaxID=1785913 RepID=A0A9W6WA60_9ACTN|nr:hypothetical protein Afil01_21220 [Actinorhabdospora filicis]
MEAEGESGSGRGWQVAGGLAWWAEAESGSGHGMQGVRAGERPELQWLAGGLVGGVRGLVEAKAGAKAEAGAEADSGSGIRFGSGSGSGSRGCAVASEGRFPRGN